MTSANMWLTDSQGTKIHGDSSITSREGSIDLISIDHSIHAPFDATTGKNTSPRRHAPFTILKEIDSATPFFNKACCDGEKIKEAMISLFRINEHGQEEEYFRYCFADIKVTSVIPMIHCGLGVKDTEKVSFVYGTIRWEFLAGNYAHEDDWNKR